MAGLGIISDELKFNKSRLIQIQDSLDESGTDIEEEPTFETLFEAINKLLITVGDMHLDLTRPKEDVKRFTIDFQIKQIQEPQYPF